MEGLGAEDIIFSAGAGSVLVKVRGFGLGTGIGASSIWLLEYAMG